MSSFVPTPAQAVLFRNLTVTERASGVTGPILFAVSPPPEAVLAGVAADAVPGLVALAVSAGFDGYVADCASCFSRHLVVYVCTTHTHARACS